jgi:hypothetical protein
MSDNLFILFVIIIMIKIFTMVKGELDIVADWVMYHGEIFGFKNLFIIDNLSRDGTWEELVRLKKKYNIKIVRLPDYKKKGEYMTSLIKTFCSRGDLAFPIDIDEFIVCFDKQSKTISCNPNNFKEIINSLPLSAVYKMNYIQCKVINENGYARAAVGATNGTYDDRGNHAKSFFNTALFNGKIDHGNHYQTNNYVLSNLCLVHYHTRNLNQMKKKIFNNVSGLGYPAFNLQRLNKLTGRQVPGNHHVRNQIAVLEKRYKIGGERVSYLDIKLSPISNFLLSIDAKTKSN